MEELQLKGRAPDLSGIVELSSHFRMSAKQTNFAKAFLAAQKMMKPVQKSAKNPHFSSYYAPLENLLEETIRVLSANDISVSMPVSTMHDGTGVMCEVFLMHSSGEWRHHICLLPITKVDPQGAGSGFSYIKRYSIGAVMAMSDTDDDDGNHATSKQGTSAKAEFIQKNPIMTVGEPADPGDYVLSAGKQKGKKLKMCDMNDLEGYAGWIMKQPKPGPQLMADLKAMQRYSDNPPPPTQSEPPPPTDSDIPFG